MEGVDIHATEEEVAKMVAEVDLNGDGMVNFEEFCNFLSTRRAREVRLQSEMDFREAFSLIDTEGKGFISPQDLMNMLTSVGEWVSAEQATEMISLADIDCDGRVSFREFCTLMTTK